MSPTVDELRNEIRVTVGRFEREVSSGFTKETLAAICEAVGTEIPDGRLPPKSEMRAEIRARVEGLDAGDPEEAGRAFRKGDLAAVAAALGATEDS